MPNYKIPICLFPFSIFYDNVIAIRCSTGAKLKKRKEKGGRIGKERIASTALPNPPPFFLAFFRVALPVLSRPC